MTACSPITCTQYFTMSTCAREAAIVLPYRRALMQTGALKIGRSVKTP